MISKIERGASTPTAVLLARLSDALGLTLSALMFEAGPAAPHAVTRLAEQPQWTDPASGYTRRLVCAAEREGDAEIVAVELPAGARVRFDPAEHLRIAGRIVLLDGHIEVVAAGEMLTLAPGDCAQIAIHLAHELHNPGATCARYLVVLRRQALPKRPAA